MKRGLAAVYLAGTWWASAGLTQDSMPDGHFDDLVGLWEVEYARKTRTEADGSLTVLEWGEAQLEVRRAEDGGLLAVWKTSGGLEVVYRGDRDAETMSLSLDWEASGLTPSDRVREQHLTGRLEDGDLVGETWILGEAARSGVRMPWRGKRTGTQECSLTALDFYLRTTIGGARGARTTWARPHSSKSLLAGTGLS